jgi:hypothetical protein
MAELNKHTVAAIIFKYNLNDTPDLRSAIVEAFDTGYSRGEAEGYERGWESGHDSATGWHIE